MSTNKKSMRKNNDKKKCALKKKIKPNKSDFYYLVQTAMAEKLDDNQEIKEEFEKIRKSKKSKTVFDHIVEICSQEKEKIIKKENYIYYDKNKHISIDNTNISDDQIIRLKTNDDDTIPNHIHSNFSSEDIKDKFTDNKFQYIDPDVFYIENGSEFKGFKDFKADLFRKRLVNGNYEFTCTYDGCNNIFPTLSRAKRHYLSHTDIRPFKCVNRGCTKYFSRKDNMLTHVKNHCEYNPNKKK